MKDSVRQHFNALKWISRNWKLFIVLLVVFFSANAAVLFMVINAAMKNSTLYQIAVDSVSSDAVVNEELGGPLTFGYVVSGTLHVEGLSGHGELKFDVHGTRKSGQVIVRGVKEGIWRVKELKVLIPNGAPIEIRPSERVGETGEQTVGWAELGLRYPLPSG